MNADLKSSQEKESDQKIQTSHRDVSYNVFPTSWLPVSTIVYPDVRDANAMGSKAHGTPAGSQLAWSE
jgi:hypothetical protein